MRRGRIFLFLILIVVVGLALLYLAYTQFVAGGVTPTAAAPLTQVYYAAQNIPQGTTITLDMLDTFSLPPENVAAVMFTVGEENALVGQVARFENFAAGAFLIVLRPFKAGDYVKVSGIEGTVKEIGIFSTTLESADHVVAFVGNSKIFSDIIHNYSAGPTRRVERTAQLAHNVDVKDAIARLKEALKKIPNVARTPEPVVEIVDFTARGPMLAVRPYTHNNNYWQVYFDTNRAICDTFGEAGYPVPSEPITSQPAPKRAGA